MNLICALPNEHQFHCTHLHQIHESSWNGAPKNILNEIDFASMEELYESYVRISAQNIVGFPDTMSVSGPGKGVFSYGT
jgi:hypothetical protein